MNGSWLCGEARIGGGRSRPRASSIVPRSIKQATPRICFSAEHRTYCSCASMRGGWSRLSNSKRRRPPATPVQARASHIYMGRSISTPSSIRSSFLATPMDRSNCRRGSANSASAAFPAGILEMETRRLGRTGFAVSVLGFGASEIGYQNVAAGTVEKLLNGALDGGLNVIDKAACYETSEESIGSAVSHRRSEYHLFTKCGHASGLPVDDWTPELVELSLARSLKRLRTEYVELLQFHSCDAASLHDDDLVA